MRRDPESILAAHHMDRSRREVFVEGPSDVLFLRWLARDGNSDGIITEADAVDLPVDRGGKRARLLALAEHVCPEALPGIIVFVDADGDDHRRDPGRGCVIFTDHRDMEGYVLRVECLEKVIRLGLRKSEPDPAAVLTSIFTVCREILGMRIVSSREGMDLPFQRTTLARHLEVSNSGLVSLRGGAYLRALLQNAGISLAREEEIWHQAHDASHELGGAPDLSVIHGKDALRVIDQICSELADVPDGRRMLWTAFERGWVRECESLTRVVDFLLDLERGAAA